MLSLALLGSLAATVAGAATTRGNFDRPPYYDGKLKDAARPAAHVPVTFRVGDPGSLDPTPHRSPALAAVLDSLREEIGRLGLTTALAVDPSARAIPLPWLTSLDDPVQVLQLTAALVSPAGGLAPPRGPLASAYS